MNFIIWLVVDGVIGWLASLIMRTGNQVAHIRCWIAMAATG